MADSLKTLDDGHADNTAPKTVDGHKFISVATFIPLNTDTAHSVNSKTGKDAAKGK